MADLVYPPVVVVIKSFWKYLEQMNKNISFSCQTNGTVDLSKNQIDLLNTFTKFNICFSIDGVGKIFDYIRQPATWQTVHNNIKKYASYFNKKRLSFFITVSNLNIFYIDSIMRLNQSNSIHFAHCHFL